MNKREELNCSILIEKPKVIILTEIFPKITQTLLDRVEFVIEGYESFIPTLVSGRGIAIYVHKSLPAASVEELDKFGFKESVWCSIILRGTDKLLHVIGCIYRSPGNSSKENNDNLNRLLLKATGLNYTHVLIAGDFNYKNIDWDNMSCDLSIESDTAMFLEVIKDTYLTQHIAEPTRFRESEQSNILDLVFSNEEHMIDNIALLPGLGKSDHCIITFNFICYLQDSALDSQKLNYYKGDYVAIKESLSDYDWDKYLNNVDEFWEHFYEQITQAMQKHIPISKGRASFRKPWMNKCTAEAIDKKRRAWVRYQNCRSEVNHDEYKNCRDSATQTVREAKYSYEKSLADNIKTDNKSFWRYVKSKTKTKDGISDLIMEDGSLSKSDEEKANVLNQFFASVFTREDLNNVPTLEDRLSSDDVLSDIDITEEMVLKILTDLNVTKSPGPDGIHNKVLHELRDILSKPLARFFTMTLQEGKVPSYWKEANVTPLFKKGNKHLAENYRPVSLTSTVCKIMETIVKRKVMDHMETKKLIFSTSTRFSKWTFMHYSAT